MREGRERRGDRDRGVADDRRNIREDRREKKEREKREVRRGGKERSKCIARKNKNPTLTMWGTTMEIN